MGFGTLFFGYMLTLAVAYYSYTDAVCGVIILMAANKLSGVNRGFFYGMIASAVFTLFGVGELAVAVWDMLGTVPGAEVVYSVLATVRYALMSVMTVTMLTGMCEVAREVGLGQLAWRCDKLRYAVIFVYLMSILLEASALGAFIDTKILVTLSVTVILATLIVNVTVLFQIYRCYMRICMPDDVDMKEKPSKIGFVEKFRRYEEERQREYAEYKLEKLKKKKEKKK